MNLQWRLGKWLISNLQPFSGKTSATSSLLTGILRDTNGVLFTPTHTLKRGKRYRYYTSQAVIQKRGEQPAIPRYPAAELERLVIAEIHRMLGALDAHLPKSDKKPQRELAVRRAGDLATKWPELPFFKQEAIVRPLLKSVTMGRTQLWIEIDELKVMSALLGKTSTEPAAGQERRFIKLAAHFQIARRAAELRIYAPDHQDRDNRPSPSLVRAVARGRMWYERLIGRDACGVKELSRDAGFECRYVRKVLQAMVLSPELTEAILSGRQVGHLTVKNLQSRLPLDWRNQAREFLHHLLDVSARPPSGLTRRAVFARKRVG